ncbi:hypothetical protein ACG83_28155 [Frankia sp. R43]|nr:hypothetical protein ACG83_28155 [Frankia sp. R43]
MNARSRVHRGAAVLVGCVLMTSVSACRAGAGQAGSAAADSTTTTTTATAAPATAAATTPAEAGQPAAPVGTGDGGPGSLTLAITSPVMLSGHVNTTVSCETAARRYVASATGTLDGATVTQNVRVAGYAGPGSYPAVISVSVVAADGSKYAISAVPTTVQVTADGGAVSFNASTSGGRALAGSISWACS